MVVRFCRCNDHRPTVERKMTIYCITKCRPSLLWQIKSAFHLSDPRTPAHTTQSRRLWCNNFVDRNRNNNGVVRLIIAIIGEERLRCCTNSFWSFFFRLYPFTSLFRQQGVSPNTTTAAAAWVTRLVPSFSNRHHRRICIRPVIFGSTRIMGVAFRPFLLNVRAPW